MDALFRKRIGISEKKKITFEALDIVLDRMAKRIPFENMAVIENRTKNITKENLVEKILIQNEGGLCYDLNLILYFFLVENHFSPLLTEAIIYDNDEMEYRKVAEKHLINLLPYKEEMYLLDAGFGGFVPLKPIPLTGEIITSANGEFRVKKIDTEHGNYVFEMKLNHGEPEWKIGYAINTEALINNIEELNKTQSCIIEHEESPFNKGYFVTRLTTGGYLVLTETSFTQSINGKTSRKAIDKEKFKELLKMHFGL